MGRVRQVLFMNRKRRAIISNLVMKPVFKIMPKNMVIAILINENGEHILDVAAFFTIDLYK